MNDFNLPSGAKPIENPASFAHQAVSPANTASMPFVSPWQVSSGQQLAPNAAPLLGQSTALSNGMPFTSQQTATAPNLNNEVHAAEPTLVNQPAPQMEQPAQEVEKPKAPRSGVGQLPPDHDALWRLAEKLCKSSICQAALRTPADVFILLAKADSIGMAWPDAFTNLYAIPNAQTGEVRISMYVRTKEGICRKYGQWDSEVDLVNGSARAWGVRYSDGQKLERTYSGFDASLRGVLTKDANGNIVGSKRWANNWPDMLRTRAVGRLLDALFPDVIGGFNSYEDLTDLQYEAELGKADQEANKSRADELLTKARRKATSTNKKAVKESALENSPEQTAEAKEQAASSLDALISDENPLL